MKNDKIAFSLLSTMLFKALNENHPHFDHHVQLVKTDSKNIDSLTRRSIVIPTCSSSPMHTIASNAMLDALFRFSLSQLILHDHQRTEREMHHYTTLPYARTNP